MLPNRRLINRTHPVLAGVPFRAWLLPFHTPTPSFTHTDTRRSVSCHQRILHCFTSTKEKNVGTKEKNQQTDWSYLGLEQNVSYLRKYAQKVYGIPPRVWLIGLHTRTHIHTHTHTHSEGSHANRVSCVVLPREKKRRLELIVDTKIKSDFFFAPGIFVCQHSVLHYSTSSN